MILVIDLICVRSLVLVGRLNLKKTQVWKLKLWRSWGKERFGLTAGKPLNCDLTELIIFVLCLNSIFHLYLQLWHGSLWTRQFFASGESLGRPSHCWSSLWRGHLQAQGTNCLQWRGAVGHGLFVFGWKLQRLDNIFYNCANSADTPRSEPSNGLIKSFPLHPTSPSSKRWTNMDVHTVLTQMISRSLLMGRTRTRLWVIEL